MLFCTYRDAGGGTETPFAKDELVRILPEQPIGEEVDCLSRCRHLVSVGRKS